ncbi:hypothetical protein LLT7_08665 [Lactococcus cremoris subsp. cremoris TIFN7]|nr:hypothetical protein LLT7_08665 [Lactococcus cremoris subsp. cremoris TIFN7]
MKLTSNSGIIQGKKDCLKLHLKPKENIFIKMLVFFTKTQQNFVVLIVKYYMKPFIFIHTKES